MPWKECHVMDERVRFVARLLDGEKMAGLCEKFGISRKTGYKIYQRCQEIGAKGLTDRSRRPHRHANQLPMVDCAAAKGRSELGGAEDPRAATFSGRDADRLENHYRPPNGPRPRRAPQTARMITSLSSKV